MINYSEVEQKLLNKLFIGYPKEFILDTTFKYFNQRLTFLTQRY